MKLGLRNKIAEIRLKRAIFKLLVLSYLYTILYISFFYSNNMNKFYVVLKYKKKYAPINVDLAH